MISEVKVLSVLGENIGVLDKTDFALFRFDEP